MRTIIMILLSSCLLGTAAEAGRLDIWKDIWGESARWFPEIRMQYGLIRDKAGQVEGAQGRESSLKAIKDVALDVDDLTYSAEMAMILEKALARANALPALKEGEDLTEQEVRNVEMHYFLARGLTRNADFMASLHNSIRAKSRKLIDLSTDEKQTEQWRKLHAWIDASFRGLDELKASDASPGTHEDAVEELLERAGLKRPVLYR